MRDTVCALQVVRRWCQICELCVQVCLKPRFCSTIALPTHANASIPDKLWCDSNLLSPAQRGKNLTVPLHITDFYATFCRRAGVDPADDHEGVFSIDSVDLWDVLTGVRDKPLRLGPLVLGHEFNLTTVNHTITTMGALIHNDWKLIVGQQGYADYRGQQYPCQAAAPGPNCNPNCLFNCKSHSIDGLTRH